MAVQQRATGISLPHVSSPSVRNILAHMPAPLYVGFQRKADHLRMSPSVLASHLLAVITISNIFEAVLDDQDCSHRSGQTNERIGNVRRSAATHSSLPRATSHASVPRGRLERQEPVPKIVHTQF